MRKSTTKYLMLAIAITMAIMATGLVVGAQNSNSSTTMTNSNSNTAKPRRPRHRPRPKPSPDAAADTGTMPAETPTPMARRTGRCDPMQQEQTDLSGTYTGKAKHGDDPAMDATLTVTGNNFTMNMGSETHAGRIIAVTTCGYTAVTVMPEGAPHAHSLRAKRAGNSLTLMSVPGEPEKMMFTTGGGTNRPRRHRTRKPAAAPSASPTPQQ